MTDVSYGENFAEQWVNQCHQVGQKLYQELPAANADGVIVLDETYQAAVKDRLDRQLAIGGLTARGNAQLSARRKLGG